MLATLILYVVRFQWFCFSNFDCQKCKTDGKTTSYKS
jgi:hypothetical protein